jgi:hypothetical protein
MSDALYVIEYVCSNISHLQFAHLQDVYFQAV